MGGLERASGPRVPTQRGCSGTLGLHEHRGGPVRSMPQACAKGAVIGGHLGSGRAEMCLRWNGLSAEEGQNGPSKGCGEPGTPLA